nr:hypothetical protein [Tanacetum cinerariifolium]
MEKIFDVMGCEDAFKTRLAVYICLRVMLWLGGKPTSRPMVVMPVGSLQVYPKSSHVHVIYGCGSGCNAARNYEILHERDDEDTERPDKR